MTDATKLVSRAAGEAVQNLVEQYEGYHAHLMARFVEILRIQHEEPGDQARRRAIKKLILAFADDVAADSKDAPE